MAKIEFPIKIDGFKCVEDIAQTVLNYTYKGKTLKEWVDSILEPQTNADRIRAMTDEELAEYLDGVCHDLWQMFVKDPKKMWLDWLKQETKYETTY